jgi:type 1 fimbriae regulatory protein FimB
MLALVPKSYSPPLKIPFALRRDREFLYLEEVDKLIAATQNTRAATRNKAIATLLFCQALQPVEICWLRWCDIDFHKNTLQVVRNRPSSSQCQPLVVNRQSLSLAEVDILQELQYLRTTDWLLESERRQRLSERSLHHIIAQAGVEAQLPFPTHPYMLRRTGLFYRAALLLQPLGLSLRQCCLLWNLYKTSTPLSGGSEIEYHVTPRKQEEAFLNAIERIKAFAGITAYDNVIDYLLGAFLLFPHLQGIPQNYWLTPSNWYI